MYLILFMACLPIQKEFKSYDIDMVPSGFPVNFALYTTSTNQYVAYYDSLHNMTLAKRNLNSEHWDYQKLDSKVAWDSHNYLSLMIDSLGYIHVLGNMHSSPLVYFKSTKPHSIQSMQKLNKMLGSEEDVTTYPEFIVDKNGKIIFHYRYGRSGNGYEIYNYLDVENQQWRRMLDVPLVDGEGKMNAYMEGPVLGPDNYYHLIWVWRNTWDCSTNHTLSYARSKNLIEWETIDNKLIKLPITISKSGLVVDSTPPEGGLINIGIKIGFDSDNKPLIGYHKYDVMGNTQLFIARYDSAHWNSKKVTNWDYRWSFGGMGTIKNELLIEPPYSDSEGKVVFGYHHIKYGDGQVIINENTLNQITYRPFLSEYPSQIDSLQYNFSGMIVNKVFDKGNAKSNLKFMLRWETLPPNRDGELGHTKPQVTKLELIEY